MKVGEQHLARAELLALDQLWFFHLNQHFGDREHFISRVDDSCASQAVRFVCNTGFSPRALLNDNLMPAADQFVRTRGNESHSVLMNLGLLRNTHPHSSLQSRVSSSI
jgi:hypothetical protein